MSTPMADIALGVLADAGLKATVGLAGSLGLAQLFKGRSASVRHAVLAAGLATVPALLAHRAWNAAPEMALSGALSAALVVVYVAGVVLCLAPRLRGLIQLARLTHRARRFEGYRLTAELDVPVTWGWTILLPESAQGWPAEHVLAALAHERAHLRRGDWWVHLVAWVSCSLLWFHPLAWMARRRLMLEAERAADDQVLAQGFTPSAYAEQLVGLMGRNPVAGLGLGPADLAVRVHAILGRRDRSARRWPVLVFCAVLAAALGGPVADAGIWAPAEPHCNPDSGASNDELSPAAGVYRVYP